MPRDRDDDRDDRYDDEDDRPRRRSRRDEDDDRPPQPSRTGKTLLIVFGILVGVLVVCGGIAAALIIPAVSKVREAASRMKASNNMKVTGLAMHDYHDRTGKLHGPFVDPPPGVSIPPQDRLSWRVAILPYMQQNSLHQQFKLDQPWNSPANHGPGGTVVKDFCDPLDATADATTRIRCFYDNGALFDSDPLKRVGFASITDGASNTLAYVDSADLVLWVRCNDFSFDRNRTLPTLGHPQRNTILVAMADGSVRNVSKSINPEVLKAAITRNGNEPPPDLGADR